MNVLFYPFDKHQSWHASPASSAVTTQPNSGSMSWKLSFVQIHKLRGAWKWPTNPLQHSDDVLGVVERSNLVVASSVHHRHRLQTDALHCRLWSQQKTVVKVVEKLVTDTHKPHLIDTAVPFTGWPPKNQPYPIFENLRNSNSFSGFKQNRHHLHFF